MANTYARELYHEVIRLLSPLAASAERLRTKLLAEQDLPATLIDEADGIGRRVRRLRTILDGMRAYTAQPTLAFQSESLKEIVQEAAGVALESDGDGSRRPTIEIRVPSSAVVEVSRSRLVQALTNILVNAADAYPEDAVATPIEITASIEERLVRMTIRDSGCGMSEENLRDALTLFSTSKANGTGFGLPLAVKIVESEHGGRLSIESAKGRGTSVHILLPKHREAGR
jgi:nitrogen fixation/metabolism regulation signal transduction histidine kinase